MIVERQSTGCSVSTDEECGCCSVEAVVGIDERGQMVLPKDIRDKAGIKAGDKLVVVGIEQGGKLCCISLIRVEELTEIVRDRLAPVMKEIF